MICYNTGTLIGLVSGFIIHVKATLALKANVLGLSWNAMMHAGYAGGGSMTRLCVKSCSRFGILIIVMDVVAVGCFFAAVGLAVIVHGKKDSSAKKVYSNRI